MLNVRADHAKATRYCGRAIADIGLTGNIVKMDPFAIGRGNDTLCAKHGAVGLGVGESAENACKRLLGKALFTFCAEGNKHLVCMVMVVMMVAFAIGVVALVLVVMMVMVALAIGVMALFPIVMMVMLMMVVMLMLLTQVGKLLLYTVRAIHSGKDVLSVKRIPRGRNDGRVIVVRADH